VSGAGKAFLVAVILTVPGTAGGCISGRILSGYPGYPFASFSVPAAPDSTFFDLQTVLVEEGYPLDYTHRNEGLINTQPGPDPAKPMYLNIVVGDDPNREGWSAVWVAGYEETPGGPKRVNPLDDVLWADVMGVSGRLSERLGGTEPLGPDERSEREERKRAGE
jgi:hypothetical protein